MTFSALGTTDLESLSLIECSCPSTCISRWVSHDEPVLTTALLLESNAAGTKQVNKLSRSSTSPDMLDYTQPKDLHYLADT
jgi:hypothetical protein